MEPGMSVEAGLAIFLKLPEGDALSANPALTTKHVHIVRKRIGVALVWVA